MQPNQGAQQGREQGKPVSGNPFVRFPVARPDLGSFNSHLSPVGLVRMDMYHKKSIALIGFRATGKTLLGRILAQECGLPFVDMDEMLSESFSMSIRNWVALAGWESFREAESRLLAQLVERPPMVLATGGGVVLSDSNRLTLREHFTVLWLQASFESIYQRIQDDPCSDSQRPALSMLTAEEEIRQHLAARLPLYREVADFTLRTDQGTPATNVEEILSFLDQSSETRISCEG